MFVTGRLPLVSGETAVVGRVVQLCLNTCQPPPALKPTVDGSLPVPFLFRQHHDLRRQRWRRAKVFDFVCLLNVQEVSSGQVEQRQPADGAARGSSRGVSLYRTFLTVRVRFHAKIGGQRRLVRARWFSFSWPLTPSHRDGPAWSSADRHQQLAPLCWPFLLTAVKSKDHSELSL